MRKAQWSSDHVKLADDVTNYTSESSLLNHVLHLKGEEVFGLAKQPINYPPNVDNDYHHLDHVIFFCP